MVSILINGACGKMGRMLTETAAQHGVSVAAGIDRYAAGAKAYYPLYEKLEDCTQTADVMVDFSRPDALMGLLEFCLKHKMALCWPRPAMRRQILPPSARPRRRSRSSKPPICRLVST